MKLFFKTLLQFQFFFVALGFLTFGFTLNAFACPDIAGRWACYESSFDYHYQENFIVSEKNGVFSYTQILTDDAGEQPTFEKIADNIDRVVSHLLIEGNDWYFKQRSFCPGPDVLQTHEVVEKSKKGVISATSTADFILSLSKMVTFA